MPLTFTIVLLTVLSPLASQSLIDPASPSSGGRAGLSTHGGQPKSYEHSRRHRATLIRFVLKVPSLPFLFILFITSNDSDSGYDEKSLSTASIASSIYDYEQENGRTYHAYNAGKYALPNDEGEQERMDLCYHSLRLTLNNRHFLAPIAQPTSILDVGTGTGIWAMDVADDYPGTHVLGIDLSPIQPGLVPPNLEFQVADAEEDWDMPGRFDLVHTRYINGFSIRSWRQFYEQAFTSMKPGGWVENQEFDLHWTSDDGSMPADGAFEKWQRLWEQGVESVGMTARCYPEVMKRQMEEAGFINVNIVPFKMPLGPWPKNKRLRQAGIYLYSSMYEGLSGLSLRVFTQMLGWSVEELEVLLALVRAEWKRKAMHIYVPIYVIYGQKPPPTSLI